MVGNNMNRYHDNEYLNLIRKVMDNGKTKSDRTGTGTISYPFNQMRFDLSDNSIPMLTTKKIHTKSIIHELLWYLSGDTNIKYLNDNGVRIWDEWADENGDLGPVYGKQWRAWPVADGVKMDRSVEKSTPTIQWGHVDQIAIMIEQLKNNPHSRRILLNAWNVGMLDQMALPPCHMVFQCWSDGEELRTHLYQRSADVGLGVPFNIVQYSILTHMIAQVTGLKATEFVWEGGDVHIYNDHVDALNGQLEREPYPSPTIKLNKLVTDIDGFCFDDFIIENYESHPSIKMKVSV